MDPVDPLTVTVSHDADGTPVVRLAGQLDIATVEAAQRAFAALPEPAATPADAPPSPVVVDVAGLTFMDSSGLTVLLTAVNRGYAVRLRRPMSNVRRLIAATGLDETLPIEP